MSGLIPDKMPHSFWRSSLDISLYSPLSWVIQTPPTCSCSVPFPLLSWLQLSADIESTDMPTAYGVSIPACRTKRSRQQEREGLKEAHPESILVFLMKAQWPAISTHSQLYQCPFFKLSIYITPTTHITKAEFLLICLKTYVHPHPTPRVRFSLQAPSIFVCLGQSQFVWCSVQLSICLR